VNNVTKIVTIKKSNSKSTWDNHWTNWLFGRRRKIYEGGFLFSCQPFSFNVRKEIYAGIVISFKKEISKSKDRGIVIMMRNWENSKNSQLEIPVHSQKKESPLAFFFCCSLIFNERSDKRKIVINFTNLLWSYRLQIINTNLKNICFQ